MQSTARSRWSLLLCCFLTAGAMLVPCPRAQAQDWRDKLKKKIQSGKERAKQFRDRVQPRARKQVERAKRSFERGREATRRKLLDTRRRVSETAKRTRDRVATFREKVVPRLRASGSAAAARLRKALDGVPRERLEKFARAVKGKFDEYGPSLKIKAVELCARGRDVLLPKLVEYAHLHGPRLKQALCDPENVDRAVAAMGVALEIHHRIHVEKDRAMRRAIDAVGNAEILTVANQHISINAWVGGTLVRKYPALAGTTLATEPTQALVYTFVAPDPDYIVGELRVLKDGRGNAVSAADVMARAAGTDTARILDALDVVDTTMSFRASLESGENVLPSAMAFAHMVQQHTR